MVSYTRTASSPAAREPRAHGCSLALAYFSEPIPRGHGSAQQRVAERTAWFGRARNAVADTDLVFLDPDNGLEVPSAPLTSPLASKYATVAEIVALLDDGLGIVLYQHGNRAPWPEQ